MEEKELTERFYRVFEKTIPVLDCVKKGFFADSLNTLKDCRAQFKGLLKESVPYAQQVIEREGKDDVEKKYVNLIMPLQVIDLALENLMNRVETKVEAKILFSEKAINEIKELFTVIEEEFRDTKDYILTKNPGLRRDVKAEKEKIARMVDESAVSHEQRLITGVCMPKASYLYIDMMDSLKRLSRGLAELAEKF